MKEELRQFLVDNYLFGRFLYFSDDDSFVGKGVIDANGILALVSFLEVTYGIEVTDEELMSENLDSINKLMRYLIRKNGRIQNLPVCH